MELNGGKEKRSVGDLLEAFCCELNREFKTSGAKAYQWRGGSRATHSVIQVLGSDDPILLYVKIRTESKGFWGLNIRQLRAFAGSGRRWCVVLLLGPGEDGYLLTPDDVRMALQSGRWSRSGSDFKINEGPDLRGSQAFAK